jgi:hypothetical protein
MNPRKLIGSPVILALIIIFGATIWLILAISGATKPTLELFGLLVVTAAGLSAVYMVKNIVKPPESKPLELGLKASAGLDNEQEGRSSDVG